MGLTAGLDGRGKSRSHRDSILGPFSPYRVAIPTQPSLAINIDGRIISKYVIRWQTPAIIGVSIEAVTRQSSGRFQ